MAGYVFISNSTKPTEFEQNNRERVLLSNVSRPCIKAATEMGYDVIFGTNRAEPDKLECEMSIAMYDSHTYRNIFAIKDNLIAYKNLKQVLKNNNVEVIHCNTPVGGMIGRLAGKRYKINKVIYTAHGFHFFKGAPIFNRTILKWAEQLMAHWTDAIITMNEEDYKNAKKFKLKKDGKVYKVHGVGITLDDFKDIKVDEILLRKQLGLSIDDIICISAGDLVKGKNYRTAIDAISKTQNKDIHYLICGVGPEREELENFALKKNVQSRVHFLGFRTDVKELMKISNIFIFTTMREGMPRSLMEAMAAGLPCIVSKVRGNVDLLENNMGGYLIDACDTNNLAILIDKLSANLDLRVKMGDYNLESIKEYDIRVVNNEIKEIYNEVLGMEDEKEKNYAYITKR
ncbi:glycosyltransferase [Peptostreptococcus equinus]|uniref:Glycosyltransferase n=1 Tax=Peptostreptococcus equinus TaxID=3003601 RepID=A0ABY7JLF0_9FIRM|nr:glycosyltransferase [Peptostreptococcus sp. CBA3647]WAW14157.1 glycosyltransferase [Peptostreptococcus sp. CBA3647]